QPFWLLATVPVLAAGALLFGPRANALAEAAAAPSARGRYLAAFQYSFTVPGVLAPSVAGLFAAGVWAPWVLVGGAACLGALSLRLLSTRLPHAAVWAHRTPVGAGAVKDSTDP
ncbi:MAG: hypothetical protein M3P83_02860, partial [Actinomycetota bacterium]|nr:hypothetical protein [Actinomycetota bacterium]